MKRLQLIVILLLTTCTARLWAQQPDTVARDGSPSMLSRVIPAMVMQYDSVDKVIAALNDSLYVARHRNSNDSARIASLTQELDSAYVQQARMRTRMRNLIDLKDSLIASNERYHKQLQERQELMEEQVRALQEKEKLLAEKEELYREAMTSSTIDKVKFESEMKAKEASIEAKSKEVELLQRDIDSKDLTLKSQRENYTNLLNEKEYYRHLVDSLQKRVTATEMENIRKQEENKYLQQKAKEAEERAAITLNKKKKVRPIQGIAMRMYRTPDWDIRLTPILASDGTYTGKYDKVIRNRNAGDIEFDFVTGASVMLWDLTNFFTPDDKLPDTAQSKKPDFSRFDQKFNYDLGFYVGFGGTKLFKNFYIGPSFRFVDFFYLTIGVNVCEYEVLAEGYTPNQHLDQNLTLDDITAKSWLVKPFISFSIDLDFLSYIKK
ncbi:MAG: hypothetical protein K6E93_03785 [Bacteroidales bacterium]|nr:hypothetical protein [Bacteroidales bacterium]